MSPASLHVKDITKTSLTLTWEPPPSGPEGITGYNIERRLSNRDEWERVARVPGKVLSHHLKGLKEGHAFFFRVTAENAAGTSKPTELKAPVELKGRKGQLSLTSPSKFFFSEYTFRQGSQSVHTTGHLSFTVV